MTNIIKNGLEEVNTSIGQLLEAINNKADLDASNISGSSFESFIENKFNEILASIDYVIESKTPTDDDPSWYRLYKSGWIEQGGMNYVNNASDGQTIPLIKTMDNTHYHIILTAGAWASTWSGEAMMRAPTNGRTINDFIYQGGQNNSSGIIYWQVSGQSA